MRTRAQSSVEFALVVTIVGIVFSVFIVFFNARIVDVQQQKNYALLEDVGKVIKSEIDLASVVENGYVRTFYLPEDLSGMDYKISYKNGSTLHANYSFVVIEFEDKDVSTGNYIFFLTPNLTGDFVRGEENTITKIDDEIIVKGETTPFRVTPEYSEVFFDNIVTLEVEGSTSFTTSVSPADQRCKAIQNGNKIRVKYVLQDYYYLVECNVLVTDSETGEQKTAIVKFTGSINPLQATTQPGPENNVTFSIVPTPLNSEITWEVIDHPETGNCEWQQSDDSNSIEVWGIEGATECIIHAFINGNTMGTQGAILILGDVLGPNGESS